jgi:hypothetical protein
MLELISHSYLTHGGGGGSTAEAGSGHGERGGGRSEEIRSAAAARSRGYARGHESHRSQLCNCHLKSVTNMNSMVTLGDCLGHVQCIASGLLPRSFN